MAIVGSAGGAAAQGADAAAAESLFRAGKALMEAKDYAHACPKLADSFRLDPGTGALLALAVCHEAEGKLTSSWGEYAEVVARAKREGRTDREQLAREKMAALEGRLPMLTVTVAPGAEKIAGLEIRRDGAVVGPGSWATPVPIDPGEHKLEATAPGRKPFATTVTVATEGEKKSVLIPVLEAETATAAGAPGTSSSTPPTGDTTIPGADSSSSSHRSMRTAGFVVGGVGVVGVVLGSVFGKIAMSKKSDAGCTGNVCPDADHASTYADARSAGNVSTVAFVLGGVALATGVTLVIAAPRASSAASPSGSSPALTAKVTSARDGLAFSVEAPW